MSWYYMPPIWGPRQYNDTMYYRQVGGGATSLSWWYYWNVEKQHGGRGDGQYLNERLSRKRYQ